MRDEGRELVTCSYLCLTSLVPASSPSSLPSSLQRIAIPFARIRRRLVRRLAEAEERVLRIGRVAHVMVSEDEDGQLIVVAGLGRFDLRILEPLRRRGSVGVERGIAECVAAGPPAATADLVRVGLTRHRVRLWIVRR